MSRITSFTIAKYQRLQAPVTVPFDRLTFLCGPNSAGKSTILDAMTAARRYIRRLRSHPTDFFTPLGYDHEHGEALRGAFSLEMIADVGGFHNAKPPWWEKIATDQQVRISKWSREYSPVNSRLALDLFHDKKIDIRFPKGELTFYVEDKLLMSVSLLVKYRQAGGAPAGR